MVTEELYYCSGNSATNLLYNVYALPLGGAFCFGICPFIGLYRVEM